jgi:outer membrane protein
MRKHIPSVVAAALLAGLWAGPAAAQDWTVKVGVTRYDTTSKTTGIQGIGVPPGADAQTGDATTAILVIERALTPNVGAEVVLGIPPRIKARATGSVAFLGDDVLSAKNVAPTLLVNWYFGDPGSTWRPYVGVGINYTRFAGARSRLAPQVELSDSVGPVVQAGVNYAVDRRWGMFASVARVDVKSDLVAVGSTVLTTTIDFRPVTYSLGVWYRF